MATASRTIDYHADELIGTTAVPKVIDFSDLATMEDGVWYTLNGIRVGDRRPAAKGVYILNRKKVVVK